MLEVQLQLVNRRGSLLLLLLLECFPLFHGCYCNRVLRTNMGYPYHRYTRCGSSNTWSSYFRIQDSQSPSLLSVRHLLSSKDFRGRDSLIVPKIGVEADIVFLHTQYSFETFAGVQWFRPVESRVSLHNIKSIRSRGTVTVVLIYLNMVIDRGRSVYHIL